MIALEKQYNYYLEHEKELLEKYEGKYLVISNNLEVYPFDGKKEAYVYGADNCGLGNFLLQYCDYDTTHTVHTVNIRLAI